METLKLEHIKPYPFGESGIKVIADNDGICRYINGIYTNGNVNLIPSIGEHEWFEVRRLKIVTHPLSDLTNPIQHNGEEFVPIQELFQIAYESVYDHRFEEEYDKNELLNEHLALMCKETVNGTEYNYGFTVELPDQFLFSCNGDHLTIPNFTIHKKLYEWRFAVDIPSHLWIDVNTLDENPYK